MKLTDDHRIQIFCAALNGIIQAQAAKLGPTVGVAKTPVQMATEIMTDATAKLLTLKD